MGRLRLLVGGSAFLLLATLASGCSTLQDGDGHWDVGSGATPATAELQPLPPGYAIVFNQTAHDSGSDNTNSRYILISVPLMTTAETGTTEVEQYLKKDGWRDWIKNSATLADGDCVLIGTPQEAFGAPAVPVLTDPELPQTLRTAIGSAKGSVVAAKMGVC
jgi:hypothetical protein